MRRVTPIGWTLLAAVATTVLLALIAPGIALIAAVLLAIAVAIAVADGFAAPISWFDVGVANDRKREALSRRFKHRRPEWETTPPDHADEPPDAIWARERRRRGLG
jgi:hypothetical protein